MSRLLAAAYGELCMVLLAPPLALMRAGRNEESGWVSEGAGVWGGRAPTRVLLHTSTELVLDYTISLGW